ncbi:MAG: ribose-5-phosphate isomerase RpiA [Pseudomonadota bacterium]
MVDNLDTDTIQRLKIEVAQAALKYVRPDTVLGVGSGSTVNAFIDALTAAQIPLKGAVAASLESERRLKSAGIEVLDFNWVDSLDIYIDGADETTDFLCLTKGGGAALTREKILATAARQFICMVDIRKRVNRLGAFPIPVEVIPFARSYVARKLIGLGGQPTWRQGVFTDNGNVILDVKGLDIVDPFALESAIEALPGVVCCGIFAKRRADIALISSEKGIDTLLAQPILK